MSVTIKKIAEVSGISRGTVDRVLNNRGRVKAETEENVRRCAEMLGYTPNIAGKALAARKKAFVIGVILSSKNNPFFDDILLSINKLAEDYEHYGISVIIKEMRGYNLDTQLQLIEELENEISALIITPIDDDKIREKIDFLSEKNIPTVTVNTDIENSKRIAYVGTDYNSGGRLAAGIVSLLKPNGCNIGIINGSNKLYGHKQRELAFSKELGDKYKICATAKCQDDDIIAYNETCEMLTSYPEIDTIFVVAAGAYGVCRGIVTLSRTITVVTFDDTPSIIEMMREDIIAATISQQPSLQGTLAMEIVFKALVSGEKPEKEQYIIENHIKIKQNY